MDTTANIKVARDYFISSQNTVLIPNKEFGKRKFLHVGLSTKSSPGKFTKQKSEGDLDQGPVLDVSTRPVSVKMRAANKQWVHPPEALLRGHIVYNVKVSTGIYTCICTMCTVGTSSRGPP